jgi:hypothetical protein
MKDEYLDGIMGKLHDRPEVPTKATLLVRRSDADQMRHALEAIRDTAATKKNGGAWAAGIATLCLDSLPQS